MTEHEAEEFLLGRGWSTSRERSRDRFSRFGGCSQCFRGDYIDPPAMCGDCEDDAYEAEREAEERAFVDALEHERDCAFDALFDKTGDGGTLS